MAAFSSSAAFPASVMSLMSYSKNTGLSGEFLLRSSSVADEIVSARTGSGGTMVGSRTGSGGAGGLDPEASATSGGGGGIGRATGGFFPPQAAASIANTATQNTIE